MGGDEVINKKSLFPEMQLAGHKTRLSLLLELRKLSVYSLFRKWSSVAAMLLHPENVSQCQKLLLTW